MTLKQQIKKEIDALGDDQVRLVFDFVAFIRHRQRTAHIPQLNNEEVARLYAKFADEDGQMAEEDMASYAAGLAREDRA